MRKSTKNQTTRMKTKDVNGTYFPSSGVTEKKKLLKFVTFENFPIQFEILVPNVYFAHAGFYENVFFFVILKKNRILRGANFN